MDPHVSLPTYPNPFNFAPTPFIPTDPAFSHPTRKHARTATLDILTLPTFDPKRCRTNPSALLHGEDPSRFYIPPHHLVQPVPSVAQSTLSESSSSTDSSSGESESESDENGERDSALGLGDGESTFTTSSSSSPSSSSSSSSSSSEDDSEATDTDSSSTLHPAMTPPPPSTLRTRLSAFLPSLRAANQALETERLAGTLNARNIENVEEEEGEGGQYIEMVNPMTNKRKRSRREMLTFA
jgi:hypothetical protein